MPEFGRIQVGCFDEKDDTMPTALFSVYDKPGTLPFAQALAEMGWRLMASEGTARAYGDAGLVVDSIAAFTGSPEILDGRVKTFHPAVYAGILAQAVPEHFSDLAQVNAALIDLVMVDLPPVQEPSDTDTTGLIERINVGGVELLRAAAKNFRRVTAIVDPEDQTSVLSELRENGQCALKTRKLLAVKAFRCVSAYDARVADILERSGE
jgi:phosphoribosylaminoimidazolecarboxamide formyltransferase/IMP cyclohydrolase